MSKLNWVLSAEQLKYQNAAVVLYRSFLDFVLTHSGGGGGNGSSTRSRNSNSGSNNSSMQDSAV